jgi:predicted Zn-dependent protease
LFDLIAALSEHREQTIWTTHVPSANDDKIRFAAAQVAFDLRDPIAVPDIDETPAQRWKIAKRFLKHTIEGVPRDAYTWMDLAIVENAMGHVGAALNAMVKAAQISPNDGDLAAVLGFSYINLNRVPQAIPPLQRAAKLLPKDYLVQSQLGYCLLVTGQTHAAIVSLAVSR